jgi:NRAMP (natural resistance-associated macrophage protein)-like metal ion transporter
MSKKNKTRGIQTIFEIPSRALEGSVHVYQRVRRAVISKRPFKIAEEYWNTLGPGLVTGASDDDPAGIATYSQAGAQFGFKFAWLSWFTFPLMATIQEMCARIGVVTGHGLAANIRRKYSKTALYSITGLLFIANTFNIGANLGAMAEGVALVFPNANIAILVIIFGLTSILLQVFTTYARYAKYLKYFAFALLAYVASALIMDIDWSSVWYSFVHPTFSFEKDQIFLVCAILGTTISPYLFFWQTSQEVEEQVHQTVDDSHCWKRLVTPAQMRGVKSDVWSGMFFSNTVMFFIIAACGAALYANGITTIETAADAALALRPFAGKATFFLFAIGIIGTGMLAIPVQAGSTSYAISESFGWKHGLYRKLKEARAFYGVIIVSVFIGVILNFVGIDPIKALIYSAVANGIIAPFILFFIVRLSGNTQVMGEHRSTRFAQIIGWFTVLIMSVAAVAAIISLFY